MNDSEGQLLIKGETRINNTSLEGAYNIPIDQAELEKLDESEIKKFQNYIFIISLFVTLFLLTPQILIITKIPLSSQTNYFSKFGWSLTIPSITYIFTVLYSYFNLEKLLIQEKYFSYVLFSIYLIASFQFTLLLGLRFANILLSFLAMISVGILILFTLNNIPCCYDKTYTKLIIVNFYLFTHFIMHLVILKNNSVEFFVIMVVASFYFAYLDLGIRKLFIELEELKMLSASNEKVEWKVLFTSYVITPIDIILYLFK
jgi:hypothetical protein